MNIQKYAEQLAYQVLEKKNAKAVSIIVMNPQNGEIMAMVNVPEFNLNDPFTLDQNLRSEALRQQAAERPKPEPIQEIAKCPPEKRGDGGLLSAFGSDPEQLFLLLLAFLLVKNGARVELIIALLYLAM